MANNEAFDKLANVTGNYSGGSCKDIQAQSGINCGPYTPEWLEKQLQDHHVEIIRKATKRDTVFFYIKCVNSDQHTVESTDSETVVYIFNGWPVYKCLHSHCHDITFRDFAAHYGIAYKTQTVTKNTSVVLKCVSDIEAKPAKYMIDGVLIQNAINTIGASGGIGKTAIVCAFVASVTTGRPFWSELDNPFKRDTVGPTGNVLFLSAEDSFVYVLRKRLESAGADLSKVFTVDISDPNFKLIKFDSDLLKNIVEAHTPKLIIFDPWQAFTPANIKLGDRNAVRQCLEPLIGFGEQYGTTTLLIAHSNKMAGMYGRNRLADSADLWDASRLVMLAGKTQEDDIRYLSIEKNNYGPLFDTMLYRIDEGNAVFTGFSKLHDEDYVRAAASVKPAPKTDEAIEYIRESLKDGRMITVGDLIKQAKASGITEGSFQSAKRELKDRGEIRYKKESNGKTGVKWYITLSGKRPDPEFDQV